jgi:hypothetical protein
MRKPLPALAESHARNNFFTSAHYKKTVTEVISSASIQILLGINDGTYSSPAMSEARRAERASLLLAATLSLVHFQ